MVTAKRFLGDLATHGCEVTDQPIEVFCLEAQVADGTLGLAVQFFLPEGLKEGSVRQAQIEPYPLFAAQEIEMPPP